MEFRSTPGQRRLLPQSDDCDPEHDDQRERQSLREINYTRTLAGDGLLQQYSHVQPDGDGDFRGGPCQSLLSPA